MTYSSRPSATAHDTDADPFRPSAGGDSAETAADSPRFRARSWSAPRSDAPEFDDPDETTGGDIDLEARHGLRRVAGLSTELADVTEVEYRQLRLERVVLVGVWTEGSVTDAENSLTELAALAETAGSQVLEGLIQRRGPPRPGHLHRSRQGRGAALRRAAPRGADTVICDGELSPSQLRTLETRSRSRSSTGPR